MQAYLINLDRAKDRWEHASNALRLAGFEVVRVAAVDGRELSLPHPDYDERKYRLACGARTKMGELGCYFSHLRAFEMFLETTDSHALICEDDIVATEELHNVIERAQNYADCWDFLRVCGVHSGTPMRYARIDETHSLAVNLTRQTGSAGYVVNRHAARQLLKHLRPMFLPYDHANDREWRYGFSTSSLVPYPISQNTEIFATQISAGAQDKFPAWRRYLTVFPFRLVNELSRFVFRMGVYARLRLKLARRSPTGASSAK